MKEVIVGNYLQWPASADDRIKVMCWVGDEPVQTHKHDFIEIAFFSSGTCIHTYQGLDVRLIPGDILVIAPHEEHSYDITNRTVLYNCLFYPDALGEDWDRLKKVKGIYDLLVVEPFFRPESGIHEMLHLPSVEAGILKSVLNRMLTEQENRIDGFELMQKASLIQFLCLLGREWETQFCEKSYLYYNKRNMLAAAIEYIEQNINDELRIESLASQAYLSPNHFRRLFKEITGLAPIDYINNLRISKARKLLEEGRMSISEVGISVGIGDQNYFSRVFRSKTGLSPSDYKKKFEFC